jgi:class 3 adenylate cyclase
MMPPVQRRLRALEWFLIVALMGSWGIVFAHALADGLGTGRARLPVWVSSASGPDAWPTVRSGPFQSQRKTALEPGDELRALEGEDLAGASALDVYARAGEWLRQRPEVRARVARAGELLEVPLALTPTPGWWAPFPFSAALLLTALVMLVRVPGWHLARRYFVACWCFSVLVVAALQYVTPTSRFEGWLTLLYPLGAALTVANAQDFTPSSRPVPLTQRALVGAVAVLASAFVVIQLWLPHGREEVLAVGTLGSLLFAGAALAGLTRGYLRADPLERRKLRWVLLGFYVAFAPNLVAPLATAAGVSRDIVRTVAGLLGLGIPIGGMVAVIGYRYLDVDRVISATASYTVVGLAALGAGLAAVPRLAHVAGPALSLDPAAAQWGLTMALAGAALGAHQLLRPRLDKRLFAERYARMQGFERLLTELGRATSVEEVARLSGEGLDALLEPASIAIYAREASSFTLVFVSGSGAPPAFDADSLLLQTLARRLRPLAADATQLDPFDRAALDTLGAAVLVPTRRREDVVAFTCLGSKRSGDIYTPEEIAYLAAIANRCSEVLLKLDDEVVIREARELQNALRRYVPGAIVEELAGGRGLESHEREVAVLFVDIRGYSGFAERRAAAEVFSTVNAHTERVSQILRAHGGAVVEFSGDGMMAVFGAPQPLPRKERAAVEAAREIVGSLAGGLEVGIGVASGPAFVGNIRAADRMIWSAIGNTTNLAARLQSWTRESDAVIAIDAATRAAAGYVCADFVHHPGVRIRGRSEPCDVFALPAATTAVP